MTRNAVLLGTTTLLLMACGGAPPRAAAPTGEGPGGAAVMATAPGAGQAPGTAEGGTKFDVSPVQEKAIPVFHLRWKSPGATLDSVARFARLPAGFVNANVRKLVEEAVHDGLGDMVDAHDFAELIDLEAPIDVVVLADAGRMSQVPEPLAAVSIGLTSLGRARGAAKGKQRQLAEGVWRIGPERDWGDACALAAAAGKSPARLVCADDEAMVERLAPYLARNVAAQPDQKADLHVELTLRPLLDRYGRRWANQARGLPIIADEFKIGDRRFDAAVKRAANALAGEAVALIHDGGQLTFDAAITDASGVDMSFAIAFAGQQSWVASMVGEAGAIAGPPPEIFWRLPRDVGFAGYSRTADPARYEAILRTLRTLLQGALAQQKFATAGDRAAIAKLLRLPFGKHRGTVTATGHFAGSGRRASASTAPSIINDVLDAALGWSLFGIEEAPGALRGYLHELVRVYNRPSLQRLMKKELGSDAKHLPVVRVVPPPRALGPGALDVRITVPKIEDPLAGLSPGPTGASNAKPIDVTVHILMMADGRRAWMGLSADREALAKLMAGLKGAAPASTTLAGVAPLGRFRNERHVSVSVTSLDGIIGAIKPLLDLAGSFAPGAVQGPINQMTKVIERMPNKGRSPIVIASDASGGDAPTTRGRLSVPRGTLVDIGHLIAGAISVAGQMRP